MGVGSRFDPRFRERKSELFVADGSRSDEEEDVFQNLRKLLE